MELSFNKIQKENNNFKKILHTKFDSQQLDINEIDEQLEKVKTIFNKKAINN